MPSNRLKIADLETFSPSGKEEDSVRTKYCIFISSLLERLDIRLNNEHSYRVDGKNGDIVCFEAYDHLKKIREGDILHWRIMCSEGFCGYLYDLLEENHKRLISVKLVNNLERQFKAGVDWAKNEDYRKVKPFWYCKIIYLLVKGIVEENIFKSDLIKDATKKSMFHIDMEPDHIKEEFNLLEKDFLELQEKISKLPKSGDDEYLNTFLIKWTLNVDRGIIESWAQKHLAV